PRNRDRARGGSRSAHEHVGLQGSTSVRHGAWSRAHRARPCAGALRARGRVLGNGSPSIDTIFVLALWGAGIGLALAVAHLYFRYRTRRAPSAPARHEAGEA